VDEHRRKVDEALRRAREIAGESGAPETEPLHVLIAVCESVDARVKEVWARLGRGQAATTRQLRESLSRREGRPVEKLSADVERLVDSAGRIARRRGAPAAEPVDLLEEMATHPTTAISRALESAGLAVDEVRRALAATAPTEPATTVLPAKPAVKSFEAIVAAADVAAVVSKDRFTLPVHLLLALAETGHPSVGEALKLARVDRVALDKAARAALGAHVAGVAPRADEEGFLMTSLRAGRAVSELVRIALQGDESGAPLRLLRLVVTCDDPIVRAALRGMNVDTLVKAAEARIAADRLPPPKPARPPASTPTLDQFGRDLTALAAKGQLGPVIGREEEIRLVARTLLRKQKSNPVLVGEPGVGKSSVVDGLALRLASEGGLPELQGIRIVELQAGNLVAGTKYRGELEERLRKILEEVRHEPNVVLFIDEIHSLVGGGAAEGTLDLSTLLKAPISRGEVRIIGATTKSEWNRLVERDAAFGRRFLAVEVREPSRDATLDILRGLRLAYETHHGLTIAEESLVASVDLSIRHLPERRLPDKARDLLDQACAQARIEAPGTTLTSEHVARAISEWTGVPAGRIEEREVVDLGGLEERLGRRVFGQDEALCAVSSAIRRSRAGLGKPNRPIGVFLLLGPTGVGKTELAKALAESLFGSERSMIRLDMSELQEEGSVSRVVGAPPGYVGHERGGLLTDAVRNRPYSVVLLDEIEKAHERVFDAFLQVFDDARLTDGKGVTVDFRNTVILMTSNAAPSEAGRVGFKAVDERIDLRRGLAGLFRLEFLNRIDDIVRFRPLGRAEVRRIIDKQVEGVAARLREQGISLHLAPEVVELLMAEGYDEIFGARAMERTVDQRVVRPLADHLVRGRPPSGTVIEAVVEGGAVKFREAVDAR
jgi:ATP-dependent Clp protease ATP-binding subunit ClpC